MDSTDSDQTGASLLHVHIPLLTGRVIIEQAPNNRCVNRRLRSAFVSGSLIGAQWVAKGRRKTKTMIRRAEPESFVRGVQLLQRFVFYFIYLVDGRRVGPNTTKSGPMVARH